MLVVVVILGILYSIMTLSVGLIATEERELEREARRLQALLESAVQDAVLQGQEYGLRLRPDGYEFSTLDPVSGEWRLWPVGDLYGPRELGERYRLELELEGRRVDLDRAPQADALEVYQPQIFLFSSDDISPFLLRLEARGSGRRITLQTGARQRIEINANDR